MSKKSSVVSVSGKNENKFARYAKAPVRMLSKVRDLYVKGMTDCSGQMSHGGGVVGGIHTMPPRSFSTNSSRSFQHEDFNELVRAAASQRIELEISLKQKQQQLPRSYTVGIGRIDEDKACDSFEDDFKDKKDLFYPRSKSAAVAKSSGF